MKQNLRKKNFIPTAAALLCLLVALNAWAEIPDIYLRNTSVENIAVDEPYLRVLVSYPGESSSGICSIDIVADRGFCQGLPIQELIKGLSIRNAFNFAEDSRRVEIVSEQIARFPLIRGTYVDGLFVRPKDETLSLKQAIENTLGKNCRVVVMPRSCK